MDNARQQVSVEDDEGRTVASADIEIVDDSVSRASLHVESGHVQPGARARLVDAVIDEPQVSARPHLQVAMPLGQTEMVDRVRERSESERTRAAGASCLIDAELPQPQARPGS